MYRQNSYTQRSPDHGQEPYIIDISQAADQNPNFRTVIWTGRHSQTVLMSIPAGSDIGLEMHATADQFIYIESGRAVVRMGPAKEKLDIQHVISKGYAVQVPAGTWHNIINAGNLPLKLFTIYAPPQHSRGEIAATKALADAAEKKHI